MKVIGITGGVGSGKSSVLTYMQVQYGAVVCQADHVAWKLQEPGQECYAQIVDLFGQDIVKSDQCIDRKKLGAIVFSDEEKLKILNQIMHPAVKNRIRDLVEKEKQKGTEIFVLEAALLLEEQYDQICDEIWFVYADAEVRRQRLREKRQYDDEKIDNIMKQQLSDDEFRSRCTKVLDNSGNFLDTCLQINGMMNK